MSTKPLTLIACVSLKQTQLCRAKDLYRSPWFIKARAYVEQQGEDWYILSAQHRLLRPEQIIEPYDLTLSKMSIQQRKQWADEVFKQIKRAAIEPTRIRFLAGQRYRKYLEPMLWQAGYDIEVPLMGLRIGQQLAWFNAQSLPVHRIAR